MATKTTRVRAKSAVIKEPELPMVPEPKTPPYRLIALLVLLLAVVGLFWYKTNTWPIVAVVNGKPLMRFTLDQQLYKQGGKEVLDTMITEKLVQDELAKNHLTASVAEVDTRIEE